MYGSPYVYLISNLVTNLVSTYHFYTVFSQNEPYTMIKDNIEQLSGNDRYEGYNIDLIDAIAKELKFNYTIQIVADSQYGKKLDNGTWNGMIGELLSQV